MKKTKKAVAKKTEWVLVETVSMFRMRYMVEVPVGKAEWALDSVTMNELNEFSQQHLDEVIVSHRTVTYPEALALCDEDNKDFIQWDEATKVKNFFNPHAE